MGFEEFGGEELSLALHPDPVVLELDRLQNQLKEKDQELGIALSEIKALKAREVLKEKAVEELGNEVKSLEEKLTVTENILEKKNLNIKKLASDKKEALAAQYAAEATIRRVYTEQKDDDEIHIEHIIAPLEADIKMHKTEIVALQEDKKALERLTKSKEAALLEAERILRSALERALIVEEVQNQNFELRRQIEICQEENKILDKTNRQKVLEVEKLSQTISELEEAILAGGATANMIRDHQRQISELNEEKKMLERELARVKISANRVATVVANEWKDENDKVMPVKQWLEERRVMQAEMQRLKDKLAISERSSKAEAQIKDKLRVRLTTLEEGLKHMSTLSGNSSAFIGSSKPEKSSHFLGILSSATGLKKRSTSLPRSSIMNQISEQSNVQNEKIDGLRKKHSSGESLLRKGLWASRNKVVDRGEKENMEMKETNTASAEFQNGETVILGDMKSISGGNEESQNKRNANSDVDDVISGFLYDRLQKEVISLRKSCEMKDNCLNAKEEQIEMLMKKVDTLTKAVEVESKKMKKEAARRENDSTPAKTDDNRNTKYINSPKRGKKLLEDGFVR